MKFNKLIFLVVILLGIIFIFNFIRTGKTGKKQVELKKITVLLDWFPNTNHTGIYVAKARNYFKEKGLEVEIIAPVETENLQSVAAGTAQFAVSSQEAVTMARAEGLPIKSIAAVVRHNTSAFASLPKSDIKEVKDFEGKRYGGWGSPIEEQVLKMVTKEAGADYSKIKNVTIGTTDFFTSIGRDSDFQWIFYGWDGVEAKRRGLELNLIWLKDLSQVLDYHTPVLVTSDSLIQKDPETVKNFLNAVAMGYEYAIENPDKSAQVLVDLVPEINAPLVLESQKWLSKEYRADGPKWGYQEETFWSRYADWLYEGGQIKTKINIKDAFTNDFLP